MFDQVLWNNDKQCKDHWELSPPGRWASMESGSRTVAQ